jgi:glycerol transport system ATP-binding protein
MSLHQPQGKSMKLDCTISTTEITGSESFIHLQSKGIHMVALMHGVHRVEIGDASPPISTRKICLSSIATKTWSSHRVRMVRIEDPVMASITLDKLAHSYCRTRKTDADFALKEIDYQWEDGGAYALLGPSGCGKTTLLNIISGLLVPSKGHIRFDGQDVTHLQPEERNIAQVFQFPVIYDTMTVRQNLAFPLINRRVPQDEITKRVNDMIEVLDLADKADRRARGLTADEKQKISLGRGLVRYDVNAILFDEPLTVIDPHMKWQLRTKLKDLHRQLGHTMIYVTHDQTEALTFADKVVVMYEGEVVQIGTPEELFNEPAHTFVGYFIGSPGMNVIPCEISGKTAKGR